MIAASLALAALAPVLVHLVEGPNDEAAEDHRTAADGGIASLFFPLAGGNCRLLRTQAAPSTGFRRWRRGEQQKYRQHHPEQSTHHYCPLGRPPAGGRLSF